MSQEANGITLVKFMVRDLEEMIWNSKEALGKFVVLC
jgi:hypothetical protein